MADVRTIGQRADGTLIGEDGKGTLYAGTLRYATRDEIVRDVIANADGTWSTTFRVGGYVIGRGTTDHDPGDYTPAAEQITVIIDGNPVTVDRTVQVIDWSAI